MLVFYHPFQEAFAFHQVAAEELFRKFRYPTEGGYTVDSADRIHLKEAIIVVACFLVRALLE